MEAKKMVVNLRDVVNSIGSRQIARGIFNCMEISSLINHPSSLSGATMTVSFKSGQIPPRRSCFLTNHFMKLLAKYLSATNFCWTSSTYLTDRDVISGKDMSRQIDPSICCSDWPDDRFVYLCSLCSAYHNVGESPFDRCVDRLPGCPVSPGVTGEWFITDLKTDIVLVLSGCPVSSFTPSKGRGCRLSRRLSDPWDK